MLRVHVGAGVGAGPGRAPGGGVGGPVSAPNTEAVGRLVGRGEFVRRGDVGRAVRAVGAELAAYEAGAGSVVWPGSVVAAPALGAGWSVTGAAFFRPLRPVDPDPAFPTPDANEPLAAVQRFRHPPEAE